jgi:hypothetical protein
LESDSGANAIAAAINTIFRISGFLLGRISEFLDPFSIAWIAMRQKHSKAMPLSRAGEPQPFCAVQ